MSAMVFVLSSCNVSAWVFFFASSFRGRPTLFPRARAAPQHGNISPFGWMVPKPKSHVKITGCWFRNGFQDGILAVSRECRGGIEGSPEKARFGDGLNLPIDP
jgi:hypothetical protein